MLQKNLVLLVGLLALTLSAADARRGFSSGGAGSGTYDNQAPTSWNVDSTLDADCQNIYGTACSDLTAAQYEDVSTRNRLATDNNYDSDTDYQTALARGYLLTTQDGTQWQNAKSPGGRDGDTASDADWNTDCDTAFTSTGGCDGLSKAQFGSIDHSSTGRISATGVGFSSYSDWQTAAALGYSMTADDATLWGQANDGSVSAAACDAEFAGRSCNQLTKNGFQNAKASNALMTQKIAKVSAGTLTNADLTELSLTFGSSALSSPLTAWQLDYLETVLGTSGSTTKDDWQATIDNYDAATASAWYIWKIAASSATSGTYATGNATTALFNTAGVSSAVTALGVSNSQIAANIRSAGFTATPNTTALNDFLAEARGFSDGASYASVSGALGNGWTLANFLTANGNGGWTQSSADKTAFDNCLSNTSASTGGTAACQASNSEWSAIAAAIAAAADTNTDLTSAQADNILAAASTTAHAYFDSSNQVMMDYLNQCISGSSNAADAVSNCVSSGIGGTGGVSETVLKQQVTSYKLGQIAATNSGTYASSTVTQSDMVNIGLATHESGIIGANYCGTAGNASCLNVIKNALGSASLTASSSASDVQNWINSTMRSHMQNTVAANESVPANPTSSGDACAASNTTQEVTLPLPHSCQHSSWTCSFQGSKSPAALTLDIPDGNVKLAITSGGPVNGVSYTIRKSLNYTGGSYYKDFTYNFNIPASSNASAAVQLTTHTGSGNTAITGWNHCINKGVGWELAEYDEVPSEQRSWSGTKSYAVAGSTVTRVPSCGSSWGQNNLVTAWSTWRNHGNRPYRAQYRDSNGSILTSACGSSSGGSNRRWWCRNASTYSCND